MDMSEELEQTAQTADDYTANDEVDLGTATDTADDDQDSDADFSDGEDEDESGDGDEGNDPEPHNDKPRNKNRDAHDALIRRKAEQQAEIKRAAEIKKARNEAIKETLGGVNPYTNESLEDDADIEEYLTMKEIEKSGKDPITDYSRYLKDKTKQQQKAAEASNVKEEWFGNDKAEFAAKHPDVSINELLTDEVFQTLSAGRIGTVPLAKLYAEYQAFEKRTEERAKTKAAQILANNAATPGKMSNPSPVTEKSVKDMSKKEFEAMVERIKRGEQK